jgi:hypothetical protein
MMQNMIMTPSSVLSNSLGIRSGNLISTCLKLFLSFSFTAAFHSVGGIFAARQQLGEFRFFLFQAVAITAEDGIMWLGKSWALKGGIFGKIFRYTWLTIFMSWNLRGWLNGRVRVTIALLEINSSLNEA